MHVVVVHSCVVYTTYFGIGGAGSPFQTHPDGPPQNELRLVGDLNYQRTMKLKLNG
jgi:hypothetical protein